MEGLCLPILYLFKNLFLLAAIKADHPVYPEFIGKHAKIITPKAINNQPTPNNLIGIVIALDHTNPNKVKLHF